MKSKYKTKEVCSNNAHSNCIQADHWWGWAGATEEGFDYFLTFCVSVTFCGVTHSAFIMLPSYCNFVALDVVLGAVCVVSLF